MELILAIINGTIIISAFLIYESVNKYLTTEKKENEKRDELLKRLVISHEQQEEWIRKYVKLIEKEMRKR